MPDQGPADQPAQSQPHVLREYALLADGERGALIGPRGEIGWLCAPRWDSAALFSSFVGGAGLYALTPEDRWFVWGGYYEEGTLVWRSRWMTADGVIECREALAFPGEEHRAVLMRQVLAVDRDAEVLLRLDPRADFGRCPVQDSRLEAGTWTARSGPLHLRLTGVEGARLGQRGLQLELSVPAGSSHDLVLEVADQPLTEPAADAARAWSATVERWHQEVPAMVTSLTPRDARHAYAVLRGLTSDHGGMVAAATTSLPERSEAGRNYDYRFSWIRDQSLAGQAAAVAGGWPVLDQAVRFVTERLLTDGPQLMPAYTVDGGPVPREEPLDHLVGYPGAGVVVGNQIHDQFQLDIFGEALLLLGTAARHDRLDLPGWRAVDVAVSAIRDHDGQKDAGIWELEPQHWAHSRLICAAGLRAVAAVAPAAKAAQWTRLAESIVVDTAADCLHPSGRWQRSDVDEGVDGALLLPAVRGALPAQDPRTRATLAAVRAELTEDGYVYRFRHDQRPLREAEGAFLLCGFVTALACEQQGEHAQARAWFERNRAACGPPGLFSEEYDVTQRQLRGNLPQAFVHALLLQTSIDLAGDPGQ
ncbi:glycoside hydrolase family 15 protein [Ruania albidiflava]|uniref:glycoside hydrolase family 15 protein n=1 Tax=Ruania albidiflava TaxID=366586 RepID=UPI0003B34E8C|nr:glycoside hydrolase family 15 protein [Ruania albidiflava]